MTSLRRFAFSGVKWAGVSQFGRQVIQIVTTVLLARVLAPSDFGLIAMALVITGFMDLFKDFGTSAAVIQRTEVSDTLASSVFWVNVGFGALVSLAVYAGAPLVSLFYRTEQVAVILQFLSVGFLISSLGITQQAMLVRKMDFERLAVVELVGVAGGGAVSILAALKGYGVWSLVMQSLTTSTISVALLWAVSGWRPKIAFDSRELRLVIRYSANLLGFNMLNYCARNMDNALIGRYLGARELGYYTLAYRFMLYPIQNVTGVVGRVLFPVLSQMQDDSERFRRVYTNVTAAIATITFPMSLGILVVAKPLIVSVFGETWLPVVTLLMILAPVGMLQSIGSTVGLIYQAKGRTDWLLRWGIVSGLITFLSFVIGLQWGVVGLSVAYLVVSVIMFYPSFAIPFRLIGLEARDLFRTLRSPLTNSVLMVVGLFCLQRLVPHGTPSTVTFVALVVVGAALYGVLSWAWNREQLRQIIQGVRGEL